MSRVAVLAWAGRLACVGALAACGGSSQSPPKYAQFGAGVPSPGRARAARVAHLPDGDWTRFGYDASRDDVGPGATGISTADLRSLQRRVIHIDGVADSSAIQLKSVRVGSRSRDVAVVTTTYGRTIAFDPGTGQKLWEYVPSDVGSYQGSAQVTAASPVADPNRQYVYAASPDGYIHKLAVATGRQVWAARITYDATREKIGGALNVSGPWVLAVAGGYYGDQPTYQGHVALIDRATGQVAHVWNALCSNRDYLIDPPTSCGVSDAAIWAREGVVVEPGSGRLLVATGNGPFNGSTNWGDSVLELNPDATTLLHNWTPRDQAKLNDEDLDLGSTAPALLPEGLAAQGGKAGVISLLDLARLDGTTAGPSSRLGGELQDIPSPGGSAVLTSPAVARIGGRAYLFVADDTATSAYVLGPNRRLAVAWQENTPGSSPVLAGGLLYVYDDLGGALIVRQPQTGRLLASFPAGVGHWSTPIVVGGRIILPVGGSTADNARSGVVNVYHLPGR